MRTFLIVLIGIVCGYLISVGIYNDWSFLVVIELTEAVKRMATFVWMSFLFSCLAWLILTELFEWWN